MDMAYNVAAFEQTARSTIALADTFEERHWDLPTDCPGWTVKDIVSHLVSVERSLLGDPEPDHRPPDGLPHVRNEMGRILEVGGDLRRPVPGAKVLAELREVLERRMAMLAETDPGQPMIAPTGRPVNYAGFMVYRAFDWYVHEQDIRRAVDRPGNLDAPAAACCHAIMSGGLPFLVGKKAGAAPGQSVAFEVTGAFPFTASLEVAPNGRAHQVENLSDPTATLRMDWETYVILTAGRRAPDSVNVSTSGDPALAAAVLSNMAIIP
jgi:uncharacterized protein (TIGR03083 family)